MNHNVTSLGWLIRGIRYKTRENAGDMAKRLGVTSATLGQIELGKLRITEKFRDRFLAVYGETVDKKQFYDAYAEDVDVIKFRIESCTPKQKLLICLLTGKLNHLSDKQVEKIIDSLD